MNGLTFDRQLQFQDFRGTSMAVRISIYDTQSSQRRSLGSVEVNMLELMDNLYREEDSCFALQNASDPNEQLFLRLLPLFD